MDLDDIHAVDDLSELALQAMVDRLERSTTAEQFIYRETELDEMWRLVDIRLMNAQRDQHPDRMLFAKVKAGIMEAHDLVGMESEPVKAAVALRGVMSLLYSQP